METVVSVQRHMQKPKQSIVWPSSRLPSEFEIQAFLYYKLKEMGFRVRGEVTGTRRTSRLDLVIFDNNLHAALIIEVKKQNVLRPKKTTIWYLKKNHRCAKKQCRFYEELHKIPVLRVVGRNEAFDCIRNIGQNYKHLSCRPLSKRSHANILITHPQEHRADFFIGAGI